MPFGGDLGFTYVLLVVLVVFPVIGLLLRRQWRLSVARSEEIRRLLVLASEESTRAEFEAFAGYATSEATISMPVQHQCAVCFCPTTTRCARCKAVRYCSGKCQIIHWRQGHKEECQPFTATYQSNDPGGAPGAKLLRQENEIHANSLETEARQCAKSVQSIPEEPASPKSDRVNDDSELECLFDGSGKNTSLHEPERSDEQQSAKAQPVKTKTGHVKNVDQNGLSPKNAILVDSVEGLTSGKLDHLRTGCTRSDTSTTSSSGWSANGSNESSLSEPSTASSGFWDGTVNSRRTKVDTLDDSSQSSSSDAGDADMHTSTLNLSFNLSRKDILPVDEQNSSSKTVMSDGAHSPNFGVKKHIHRAVFLEERGENVSESKGVPPLRAEKSDYVGVHPSNDSHMSKAREPGSCASSINSYPTPSYKGPSGSKHTSKSGRLRSLSPERSNHAVIDTNSTLHRVESKEVGSLSMSASTAYSSGTRTHSLQDASMLKVGSAHDTVASSDYIRDSSNARNGLKTSTHKIVDHLKVSKSSGHRQATAGSEVAGKYNNKGLFPYEQFVKLYNWNKIELRPCGLTNCGNSCYANAVLQCLACTPPLTAYFIQGLHSKACEKREWCFTCEFESLILKVKEGISPLSPIRILSQIQNIGSHLGNGREEDAHEFLRYAIEKMQSVCLKEARAITPNSLEEETTLIGLTFGGYLRSKIKCMRCGGKSERHERMMDLTVEIEGDIETLEGALRKFTGTEILDGENKYQCSRCRSYERAKKKLKVLEAPNILTIALKRFQSGKFGKLNKSIRFPEILDLAPYMSGTSDKSPIYKLYGVVVHLDVMNATFSGHYVCYVKNAHNKWFKMDDSVVTAVERENVLSKRAYMLLYARCSPRAPRSIRNLIVPPDPRKQKNPLLKLRSHSACSWDAPIDNSSNRHTGIECLYPNHSSFHPNRTLEEDDSSSENSSSLFSEGCSCSTDSTNRDSSSTDDFFDHLFRDTDQNWNTMWKHSSDSDSSSSSSSSSPSPLYTKRSPLADSERYSSGNPETSAGADRDDDGFWARSVPSLYSSTAKQCRKLGSSSSETDPDRLGWANTFANDKLGSSFRRSTRERGN